MPIKMSFKSITLLLICLGILVYAFPFLFSQSIVWQREFNQLISSTLHQIKSSPIKAGGVLVLVSFIYGVLHALGPGHGKFVIGSYLATHPTKLKHSIVLTFLAALMQSFVAIMATSIVVVGLNFSSRYFRLSQLWLERIAYLLILMIALQWLLQGMRKLLQQWKKNNTKMTVISVQKSRFDFKVGQQLPSFHLADKDRLNYCGCGHQHLPNEQQMNSSKSLKDQFLIILSIGMRPCSGAIFILFLAYMLDLYYWGILATVAMGIGVGLTLSAFALLVLYARGSAVKLGKWYVSPQSQNRVENIAKLSAGMVLLCFSLGLLYATTLPTQGGAALFLH